MTDDVCVFSFDSLIDVPFEQQFSLPRIVNSDVHVDQVKIDQMAINQLLWQQTDDNNSNNRPHYQPTNKKQQKIITVKQTLNPLSHPMALVGKPPLRNHFLTWYNCSVTANAKHQIKWRSKRAIIYKHSNRHLSVSQDIWPFCTTSIPPRIHHNQTTTSMKRRQLAISLVVSEEVQFFVRFSYCLFVASFNRFLI